MNVQGGMSNNHFTKQSSHPQNQAYWLKLKIVVTIIDTFIITFAVKVEIVVKTIIPIQNLAQMVVIKLDIHVGEC